MGGRFQPLSVPRLNPGFERGVKNGRSLSDRAVPAGSTYPSGSPPIFCTSRVELVDQRGDRQVRAVSSRLGEADRQVLAHPVDREAEVVLAGHHGLVAVLHLPGLRRALGDGGDQRLDVEAGLLGEVDALGEALHQSRDADLVDHLGELARAGIAEELAHPRVGRDHRLGAARTARRRRRTSR